MFLQIYDAVYLDCPHTMVHDATSAIDKAVEQVCSYGYWSRLEQIYRRTVPLKHDVEIWD